MSGRTAKITSVDALSRMHGAVSRFVGEVRDALVQFALESRRPTEWIENDRRPYWTEQVHKAMDAVNEAKQNLQRAQLTVRGDDTPSCYDEKKQLEKAKRRLEFCEERLAATKRWIPEIAREVEEFSVSLARFEHYLDTDVTKAQTELVRLAEALEAYLRTTSVSSAAGILERSGGLGADGSPSFAVAPEAQPPPDALAQLPAPGEPSERDGASPVPAASPPPTAREGAGP